MAVRIQIYGPHGPLLYHCTVKGTVSSSVTAQPVQLLYQYYPLKKDFTKIIDFTKQQSPLNRKMQVRKMTNIQCKII